MWNPFGKKKEDQPSAMVEAEKPAPTQLLEDLSPKFEDNVEAAVQARRARRPSLKEAISSISLDDFKNLHKIPCFRDGFVTGGSVSIVVFGVMMITRSPLKRALNWTVGSFALSSTAAWEQCRFKKRKSQRNAALAKSVNRESVGAKDPGDQSLKN